MEEEKLSRPSSYSVLCLLVSLAVPVVVPAATIGFEDLADLEILTNQYSGLTFSNAITLKAGTSLNEFDFPPQSGSNVISDNSGAIEILFSTPALSFSGYFTYVAPLTLEAFDIGNTSAAITSSAFSANDGATGELGSSPNEFLQLSFAGGISRVVVSGDPLGSSFTMDDMSLETATAPIPEPSAGTFAAIGAALLYVWRRLNPKNH